MVHQIISEQLVHVIYITELGLNIQAPTQVQGKNC